MQTLLKALVLSVTLLVLSGCLRWFGPENKVEEFLKSGDYQLLSKHTQSQVSAVEFSALYRPKLKHYLPADNKLAPIEKALKSLVLMEFSSQKTDQGTIVRVDALYPKALDEMQWFGSGVETKLAFKPLIERLIVLYRFKLIEPGEVDFSESVETFILDDSGIVLDVDALRKARKTEKQLAKIDAQIIELTPDVAMWRMRSEKPKNYERFKELMRLEAAYSAQLPQMQNFQSEIQKLKPDYEHLALTSWYATLKNIRELQALLAHVESTVKLEQLSLVDNEDGEISLAGWVTYNGPKRFSADCMLQVISEDGNVISEQLVPQFLFNIAKHTDRSLIQRVKLPSMPKNSSINVEIVAVYPEYLY